MTGLSIDEMIDELRHNREIDMFINDISSQIADWLEELKQLREKNKWIPVVVRAATDEEREELKIETICDFPLPDDGQEILISKNGYVYTDTCCWDGYNTWLDGSGAWADIDAWQPLPKPYRTEEDKNEME